MMEMGDDGRRRSFRSSKKIIPETYPEIQGFSDQIFGISQEVGETEIEDENDEMEKTKSSSSPQKSKVEKTKKIGKGNISTKEKQMESGKVFTEPEFRPGSNV